jgi:hypothetical protein
MADTLSDVPEQASPSAASQDDRASTYNTPGEDTAARSPSADQGETRETLLEAVQKAVSDEEQRPGRDSPREASGAPLTPGPQSETAAQRPDGLRPSEPDLPDEVSEAELSQYPPQMRRRITKLVKQRHTARTEVDQLKQQLGPGAEAADQVSKYLRDNDISREDFLLTLELAAAMRRGDFRAFYAGVKPYMDLAEQYLGLQLPQDLQAVVQRGEMSPQAAAIFHRERMDRALSDTQRLRQAHTIDMRDSVQAQHQLRQNVMNSVNAWEAGIVQQDPDYALKKAAVNDTMWSVLRERGNPQTPEQAVGIAQEAYQRVNRHYQNWGPPPRRPTSRTPTSTGRYNGAGPEPRNLREAVEQAIDRARA